MGRAERTLSVLAAGVFVAAGAMKVVAPADFALSIARLQILPRGAIGAAAILLPWIEIVAGLAFVAVPSRRDAARWLLSGLLLVFSAALAVAMARGVSTCGCFGTEGGFLERPPVALVRNALLLAALWLTARGGPASPASGRPA
jgi:hypothetical protein